jgi:hypothetical protein
MDSLIRCDGFAVVELKIPGVAGGQTGTQFNFLDQALLRTDVARIKAVESYTVNSVTGSPVSNGTLASIAIMKTCSLTLVTSGKQLVQNIPLARLNTIQNASTDPFVRNLFELGGLSVNWTDSFAKFTAAPANTTDIYLLFGVYYDLVGGNY